MSSTSSPSSAWPQYVTDLVVLVALLALAAPLIVGPVEHWSTLRLVLGLPLAVFVPGYAIVAAAFPRRHDVAHSGTPGAGDSTAPDADDSAGSSPGQSGSSTSEVDDSAPGEAVPSTSWLDPGVPRGITGVERAALSVVLSVALVAFVALAASVTRWGIAPGPIFAGVAGLTLLGATVAALQRARLASAERFAVPVDRWIDDVGQGAPTSAAGWVLVAVVAASLIAATGAVAYAWSQPTTDVEFYLLTDGEDGELRAEELPDEVTAGEPVSVTSAVEHHGPTPTEYAVVTTIERQPDTTRRQPDDEVVHERSEATVRSGERWTQEHTLPGSTVTEDLRLHLYLYEGSAPERPGTREPVRHLTLTLDVSPE